MPCLPILLKVDPRPALNRGQFIHARYRLCGYSPYDPCAGAASPALVFVTAGRMLPAEMGNAFPAHGA